jgi:hypothetical protein
MNKYGRFDHRNIPITLILFGIAFLVIGSINVFQPNQFGSPWMIIPGAIILISGFGTLFLKREMKEDVKNALESYNRVSLNQLASELNMDKDELTSVILNLRNEGEIIASFDYTPEKIIVESRSR